jgi:hypothetical protein
MINKLAYTIEASMFNSPCNKLQRAKGTPEIWINWNNKLYENIDIAKDAISQIQNHPTNKNWTFRVVEYHRGEIKQIR